MVQELERRGARVACTYTGGLDFSVPVQDALRTRLKCASDCYILYI